MNASMLLSYVMESVQNDLVLCVDEITEEERNSGIIPLQNNENIQLSAGLWSFLRFEEKENYICDGELTFVHEHTGSEYFAICKIHNNSVMNFEARGKLALEKIFIFSLRPTSDETDPIVSFFHNTKLAMGLIELVDKEWSIVKENTFAKDCKLIHEGSNSDRDPKSRQAIYDGCKRSEFTHTFETVCIGKPHIAKLYICYLGKAKYTRRSRFSYIAFDTVEEKIPMYSDMEIFFLKAPACRMVKINDMAERVFTDIHKETLLFEDDRYHDMFLSLYKRSLIESEPIHREVEYPMPGGDIIFFYCVISCLNKSSNGVSRHAFVLNDITQQRRAEIELVRCKQALAENARLELRESEDRFQSLVASAPSIIITIDGEGRILFTNRKISESEDVLGKTIDNIFVDGPVLMEKIHNVFVSSTPFTMELRLKGKDMWFSISVAKVNEKIAIVVATDVTTMKQLSEDLRRAVSAKSRFLANMSHEIRTPLSGIIGMSRMLAETGLTLDQADCVSTIQQCGETLLSVINDVLDYTKLEATGGMEIVSQPFSLQQILEDTYTVLPLAEKKGIEMILDIEPNTPDWIMGDSMRLRQIIVNLLNNSTKFTSSGYIRLSLHSEKVTSSDYIFHFSVKDTGCGILPENQPKLFQMFYQVDNSTTRRFGGTGIGLALARKFAELMGGKIWVESTGNDGDGAKFCFTMKAELSTSTPPPNALTAYSLSLLTPQTAVVIVDKSEVASLALKKRLQNKGFSTISTLSTIDELLVEEFSSDIEQILCFLDTDCNYSDLPQSEYPIIAYVFMGTKRPEISPPGSVPESPTPSICDSPLLPKLSSSTDSLRSSSSLSSSCSFSSTSSSNPVSRSNSFSRSRSSSLSSIPSIFDFARKPLKDSAICRCINYISLQLYHCSSSTRSPPLKPAKSRSDNVVVYPLEIMVVEDNEINQRVIRRMLQQIGYATVSVANNGCEALEIIEQSGVPDLIFMDIQMPVLDGVECTRILRKRYESWPYIVALTADAFPEDRDKCLTAGMNDFLTKPIRLEQLQGSLESCFSTKLRAFTQLLPPKLEFAD